MVAPLLAAAGRAVVGTAANKTKNEAVGSVGGRIAQMAERQAIKDKAQLTGEQPSLVLFLFLGMIALLKDILDMLFNLLNVIPGLSIVFDVVIGGCISLILFLLLTIFDRSAGSNSVAMTKAMVRRAILFLGATFVGTIPLLGMLPETTLAIVVLYILAHRAWRERAHQSSVSSGGSTLSRSGGYAYGN